MQQASLFDISPAETRDESRGLAGLMPAIRARMNSIAARDSEGRKKLIDRINEVAQREALSLSQGGGKTISLDVLNKWLQPSDRAHMPSLEAVVCFCIATGDSSPFQPLLKAMGLTVIPANKLEYLEYGETCAALRQANKRKKSLEAKL
jgi:hypothetical protein